MKHETLMALSEKWRKAATDLAAKDKSYPVTHRENLEKAHVLMDCASELLLAYSDEMRATKA